MANRALFQTQPSALPSSMVRNQAGAPAYAFSHQHALAQLAITGCLNQTYYASAETQLSEVIARCMDVPAEFVAKTAIYARQFGNMKDMPALLVAYLASFDGALCEAVFEQVIDNGKMLRNFVQILRSGVVARKSLGTRPKRLVQRWLENATDQRLISAMVGNQPSLCDVIKMVHPKANSPERTAFFGYLIGKTVDMALLPVEIQALEVFRKDATQPVPNVPFQLLTSAELSPAHWRQIATYASWQTTRMNLNTFVRHDVFSDKACAALVAARLADAELIAKARAFPYQLLAAHKNAVNIPEAVRAALAAAVEVSVRNVPKIAGSVAIAVDVSGSMSSPVSGYRAGASSTMRCVDVAGMMAATIVACNPGAMVLPFNDGVQNFDWRAKGVLAQAGALAAMLGGGTNISAPLQALKARGVAPDLVIILSDNQSWLDARHGQSATMQAWAALKARNPGAKLVCVDLQPYTNSQAQEGGDVLNIGGFSDEVFALIANFAKGELGAQSLVAKIQGVCLPLKASLSGFPSGTREIGFI
jgi:60 kDa SS-A/Ro ribonucleoprotein